MHLFWNPQRLRILSCHFIITWMLQLPVGITSLNYVQRKETKLAVEVSYPHDISAIESKNSPTKHSIPWRFPSLRLWPKHHQIATADYKGNWKCEYLTEHSGLIMISPKHLVLLTKTLPHPPNIVGKEGKRAMTSVYKKLLKFLKRNW